MKKIFHILFSLYLLLVLTGVTLNVHYCHGNIVSVKLFANSGKCCCDEEKGADNCCENESVVFHFDNQQIILNLYNFSFEQAPISIPESNCFKEAHYPVDIENEIREINIPPPQSIPKRVLFCSLTYYG